LSCGSCRSAASRFEALLGALPLAIETGPVAELLQLIGAAIVCGFVGSPF
jgi:multidrug efflux pump subunit AcrB